jgi:hypothetical protein
VCLQPAAESIQKSKNEEAWDATDEATAQVFERNLPTVVVDRPDLKEVSSVSIDDRRAAREAAAHLIRFVDTLRPIRAKILSSRGAQPLYPQKAS